MRRTVSQRDWMGDAGAVGVGKVGKMIPPKFGTLTTRKMLELCILK